MFPDICLGSSPSNITLTYGAIGLFTLDGNLVSYKYVSDLNLFDTLEFDYLQAGVYVLKVMTEYSSY